MISTVNDTMTTSKFYWLVPAFVNKHKYDLLWPEIPSDADYGLMAQPAPISLLLDSKTLPNR